MRVTPDHWLVLVDYAEGNNEIVTNQLVGPRGRENLTQKWNTLTVLLNSLEEGSKSVTEWKKSFSDWKCNVKKKHSIIRQSQTGTGGGPHSELTLTDLELRLLQLMGSTALNGDEGVKEFGLPKQDKPMPATREDVPPRPNAFLIRPSSSTTGGMKRANENTDENFRDEAEDTMDFTGYSSNATSSRKRKAHLSIQIEKMNDLTLNVLTSIDGNISSIAGDLKKLVPAIVDNAKGHE